jgi:hypothetical protein
LIVKNLPRKKKKEALEPKGFITKFSQAVQTQIVLYNFSKEINRIFFSSFYEVDINDVDNKSSMKNKMKGQYHSWTYVYKF